ncbi:hypothetical protein [Bacillus methanolicus]|uniref:hypothetical protein n=1 Tax=Bacillus methanolicus TaxID=1471 RepID=UPI00200E0861|nr:hypothetical protein [Bacillus methanolicus]
MLSDRIYLLPGTGKQKLQEVRVDLARPRKTEHIYQPEFIALRKELEWLIRDEK